MAWAQYAHPEFGFFCPTPRLRRELRIAFVSILFGAIGGAVGVVALSHRNADPPTAGSVMTPNTAIAVPPSNGEATSATAQSHNGLQGGPQRSPGLTAKNEVTKGDTAPADDKTSAAKTACQDYASYMSGPCLADRPRRVRVRTATDGPEVARLPLGRPAAPSDGLLANPPDGTAEELQGSAQDNATATTTPSSENDNRAHSSGAPAKKPQTTARSQNRHRNDSPWRGNRADPGVGNLDTNDRGGRLGQVYARDGSHARQGFWDWSR
jgi:hypothetical protein